MRNTWPQKVERPLTRTEPPGSAAGPGIRAYIGILHSPPFGSVFARGQRSVSLLEKRGYKIQQVALADRASGSVEDDVMKTDEAYRLAKLHRDAQALDRILADEFSETNQNGRSRNKAQILELWRTFSIGSLTTDTFQVRVAGDTATVFGTQTENGTERMLFMRVYVKRPNAWQLLASMQFRDPTPVRQ